MTMQIKKLIPLCFFVLSALPALTHADIEIVNNTDSFGTAKISDRCSSSLAGEAGIIKARSSITIPQFVINTLCLFSDCDAVIYANNNHCDGKVVGTATVNRNKGVTHVQSLDTSYIVSGLGNHIEINASSHHTREHGVMSWLKSLLTRSY
jgi:hypothetical protein